MAQRGDQLQMPDGTTFVVERSASETDGAFVELLVTIAPGQYSPPPHVHPRSVDEFEVLEGGLEVMIEGRWTTLQSAQGATIPAGTLHTVRNATDAPVKMRVTHRPAVRFETYIEHMHALANARGIRSGRDPRVPILFSMLMLQYSDTLVVARLRERVATRALAAIGRAMRLSTAV